MPGDVPRDVPGGRRGDGRGGAAAGVTGDRVRRGRDGVAPPGRVRRVRDRLGGSAFPALRPSTPATRAGAVLLAALAGVVAYLRLSPDVRGSIWAEDGTQFLADELAVGAPATLTDPYAGYMHLYPRLAAAVAGRLPLGWADDVLVVAACVAVALAASTTAVLARGHLPSRTVRLLLAGMVVVLPVGGLEVSGSTANSHWYLMLAAFWALTSRPAGGPEVVLASVVVALAMGSDPLTLLLLPLVLVRLVVLRRLRDHVVSATFVVAAAVQLAVVLTTERTEGEPTPAPGAEADPTPTPPEALASYLARVPFVLVVGVARASAVFDAHGWWVVAGAAVALLAAGVVAALGDGRTRWVALVAVLASVTYYVVPAAVSWDPRFDPSVNGVDPSPSSRYLVVPMLLLVAVVAAALQAVQLRRGGRALAAGLVLVLLVAGASVPQGFRPSSTPRAGPAWDPAVTQARQACREQDAPAAVTVQIAPDRPGWVVDLPCVDLR